MHPFWNGRLRRPEKHSILYVEEDRAVRLSRCAVLKASGYDPQSATCQFAQLLLSHRKFDLIVMSALGDFEMTRIVNVADGAKLLVLELFISKADLLKLVAERLGLSSGHISVSRTNKR